MLEGLYSRLLASVTIAYITGIFLSRQIPPFSLLPCYFFTASCVLLFIHIKKRVFTLPFLLLLFLLVGIDFGRISHIDIKSQKHIASVIRDNQESVVIGKVLRIYGYNGELSKLDLESRFFRTQTSPFQKTEGIIRLSLRDRFPESVMPGDIIAVRAILRFPYGLKNKGSFYYPEYLAYFNIYVTGRVSSALHIQNVDNTLPSQKSAVLSIERVRARINRFIDSSLPDDRGAIYKAILTGDRSSISRSVLESFKRAGCFHLLAISGLHITLLGGILYTVLFWLFRRSEFLLLKFNCKKAALILSLLPLLSYTMLAGGKTPVMRAFTMIFLVVAAVCSNRKHSFAALIACAAFTILLFQPEALFTPSFQLTFAAVISIGAAGQSIVKILHSFSRSDLPLFVKPLLQWIIGGCAVSLAATAGTSPLLLYHFNRMSFIGVLSNIVVEPLLCLWSLVIGFIALPFIFLNPAVAKLLLHFGGIGIDLAIQTVSFFQSLPFASLYLPSPHIALIIFYYISFLLMVFYIHISRKIVYFTAFSIVLCIFLLLKPFPQSLAPRQQYSHLTFLDIGHGSCTFISLPGGKKILIDGGAISSPRYDMGQRVIAPFLWHQGIRELDKIIITHPDSDHYNGLEFILDHFPVKELWVSTRNAPEESWQNLLRLAEDKSVRIITAQPGLFIHKETDTFLEVVANTASADFNPENKNNGIILRFTHSGSSVLFPGDIPASVEKKLTLQKSKIESDILLASHHGSATSNSLQFLQAVKPKQIVVSSAKSRKQLFPAKTLVQNSEGLGITLLPLFETGSVEVTMKKGEYDIRLPFSKKPSRF